jgi:hypothetical protein
MLLRFLPLLIAVSLGGLVAACSGREAAPSEPATGSNQAGMDADEDDARASVVTVTAVDLATGTLSGTSAGQPFSVVLTPNTIAKPARMVFFPPTPVASIALDWNRYLLSFPPTPVRIGILSGDGGFGPFFVSFASTHANLRVTLAADGTAR